MTGLPSAPMVSWRCWSVKSRRMLGRGMSVSLGGLLPTLQLGDVLGGLAADAVIVFRLHSRVHAEAVVAFGVGGRHRLVRCDHALAHLRQELAGRGGRRALARGRCL